MYELTINGTKYFTPKDISLLRFLREDLGLMSAKDGCSEGACGTCTVIIDGQAVKACVRKTSKLSGKNILTLEGLSNSDKQLYSYTFSVCGAVQCGYCIPGMIMSAKALLDKNLNPTEAHVRSAIKSNICRCTGYVKIVEAIMLAAKMLRENISVPQNIEQSGKIGSDFIRVDAHEKALGTAQYVADMKIDGMCYGGAVRSKYPRAKILNIDISKAQALNGVLGVLTAKDIPGEKYLGHLKRDWAVMIGLNEETHYVGDVLVLIAAQTKEILEVAKSLVEIEYLELPPVTSPAQSLSMSAPKLFESGNILAYEHLIRGNADDAIAKSKYVVTNKYTTPFTEHAFLEPESACALPERDGVIIYSGDQGVYQTQKECALMLGINSENVRVIAKKVGGGFGGKEDMSVQHHAALLAYICKKPVMFTLSRKESIAVHPKRHAMELNFTTACDENGCLTALKAEIISDTGAYASLGGPVLQRACTHAAGPYNYHNIDITGTAVYTNNPPAGAFRGFGVTQSCFALESNLNQLAKLAGISPFEIRYINAIRPGQTLPNGQIADDSTALSETLEAVKCEYENNKFTGIACAMKNSGLGVGVPDTGRCTLKIMDGKVHIFTGAACIGQGLATVATQIICETTSLLPEFIVYEQPDTATTPDSGNTTASRQTVFMGEATRLAAQKLQRELAQNKKLSELNGQEFSGEYSSVTDKLGSEKVNPVSHVAYGYATHLAILNEDGTLKKFIAAHDVGRAINKKNIEGQIEGGVVMSLGYALTENYPLDNCVPQAKFGTLGLFRATDVPEILPVIVEKNDSELAYGAKGIGEICSIPTAPAVALAYENFDGKFRTALPLADTPYSKNNK